VSHQIQPQGLVAGEVPFQFFLGQSRVYRPVSPVSAFGLELERVNSLAPGEDVKKVGEERRVGRDAPLQMLCGSAGLVHGFLQAFLTIRRFGQLAQAAFEIGVVRVRFEGLTRGFLGRGRLVQQIKSVDESGGDAGVSRKRFETLRGQPLNFIRFSGVEMQREQIEKQFGVIRVRLYEFDELFPSFFRRFQLAEKASAQSQKRRLGRAFAHSLLEDRQSFGGTP